jgi:hypothetical protein
MKADQLDIYTSKAVVTHYTASVTYSLDHVAERTVFTDWGTDFLALSVSIDEQWTDAQSVPKATVWIKGVRLLKDGTKGKKFINQRYWEGHFSHDPRFQQIVNNLLEAYYKTANKQVTALDSFGHLRPEYVGAN